MSSVRVLADLAAVLERDDPLAVMARNLLEDEVADLNRFGAQLQDAAVTPNADPNALVPPTNAGQADAHCPQVVAIEVGDPRREAAIKAARAAGTGPYAGEKARQVASFRAVYGSKATLPEELR